MGDGACVHVLCAVVRQGARNFDFTAVMSNSSAVAATSFNATGVLYLAVSDTTPSPMATHYYELFVGAGDYPALVFPNRSVTVSGQVASWTAVAGDHAAADQDLEVGIPPPRYMRRPCPSCTPARR